MELGCFDGKLCGELSPLRYTGIDQNEMALNAGRSKFGAARFLRCTRPSEFAALSLPHHDVAICMETLEHVPPVMVEPYIRELSKIADRLIITVPNEQGPAFLVKRAGKVLLRRGHRDKHSWGDFVKAALGRRGRPRSPDVVKPDGTEIYDHRGFDYRDVVDAVRQHCDIEAVVGIHWPRAPLWANFTIGIPRPPKAHRATSTAMLRNMCHRFGIRTS